MTPLIYLYNVLRVFLMSIHTCVPLVYGDESPVVWILGKDPVCEYNVLSLSTYAHVSASLLMHSKKLGGSLAHAITGQPVMTANESGRVSLTH